MSSSKKINKSSAEHKRGADSVVSTPAETTEPEEVSDDEENNRKEKERMKRKKKEARKKEKEKKEALVVLQERIIEVTTELVLLCDVCKEVRDISSQSLSSLEPDKIIANLVKYRGVLSELKAEEIDVEGFEGFMKPFNDLFNNNRININANDYKWLKEKAIIIKVGKTESHSLALSEIYCNALELKQKTENDLKMMAVGSTKVSVPELQYHDRIIYHLLKVLQAYYPADDKKKQDRLTSNISALKRRLKIKNDETKAPDTNPFSQILGEGSPDAANFADVIPGIASKLLGSAPVKGMLSNLAQNMSGANSMEDITDRLIRSFNVDGATGDAIRATAQKAATEPPISSTTT